MGPRRRDGRAPENAERVSLWQTVAGLSPLGQDITGVHDSETYQFIAFGVIGTRPIRMPH